MVLYHFCSDCLNIMRNLDIKCEERDLRPTESVPCYCFVCYDKRACTCFDVPGGLNIQKEILKRLVDVSLDMQFIKETLSETLAEAAFKQLQKALNNEQEAQTQADREADTM